MTGPIKPPGSSGLPPGASAPTAASKPERAEAFREALETAPTSAPSAAGESAPSLGPEAVERLIADALASPMAAHLTDEGRQELEAHLRSTLSDDPNLAALVSAVEG
ncbi:MAG: hypothetical protein AAF411_21695 [Myxococcota bacterium]